MDHFSRHVQLTQTCSPIVLVHGIDDQWQIDLVDLFSLSHVNDDYKFILTCIDVLSKCSGTF